MSIDPHVLKMMHIFHPNRMQRYEEIKETNRRFVHYTSATAALSMIKNKEVWMRNASCMNDYSEIEYGRQRLADAYRDPTGENFKRSIDCIQPGLCAEVEQLFDGWSPTFHKQAFLTCLSEHMEDEDRFGRLSMWRAYGKRAGVALVLNNLPFITPSDVLKVSIYPVVYQTQYEFNLSFQAVAETIFRHRCHLTALSREEVKSWIFSMFRDAALCTKHPGFKEEREWRLIYMHDLEPSARLQKDLVAVGDTPQPIYKIPLKNYPNEGLVGIEIPELINRIIIGPSEFSHVTRNAFVELLQSVGVSDADARVTESKIPLR